MNKLALFLLALTLTVSPLRAQEAPSRPLFNPIVDAPGKLLFPVEMRNACATNLYWTCQQIGGHAIGTGLMVVALDRLTGSLVGPNTAKWTVFGITVATEVVDVIWSMNECGKTGCHDYEPAPALDPFIDFGFRTLGALVIGPALNKLLGGR